MDETDLRERLLSAWIGINGIFKDSRMTRDLTYNEAVVMKLVYDQYRVDDLGRVSMQTVLKRTNMLKSLANRTVNSLCEQGYLLRERGDEDARMLFVRLAPDRLSDFLVVHGRSLELVQAVIDVIGDEDAVQFVRICEKFLNAELQI